MSTLGRLRQDDGAKVGNGLIESNEVLRAAEVGDLRVTGETELDFHRETRRRQ